MGRLVLLSENLFNTRAFPLHVLDANQKAAGREVERVSSGRRQKSQNHWTPTTENAEAWVESTYNRVRLANTIFLDRGHNLKGKVIRIRFSADDFVTYDEVGPITIPTQAFLGSRLASQPGALTEEGAWGWRFGNRAGKAVRVVFDAMGAGLRPEVVGLYLGFGFRCTNPLVKPFDHGRREVDYPTIKSPTAWVGAGEISQRRRSRLNVRLEATEYFAARYHFEEMLMRARPSWVVTDDEQAELAYLTRVEPQTAGFQIAKGSSEWEGSFDVPEHEPRIAA